LLGKIKALKLVGLSACFVPRQRVKAMSCSLIH
jgi:hypothetical protein